MNTYTRGVRGPSAGEMVLTREEHASLLQAALEMTGQVIQAREQDARLGGGRAPGDVRSRPGHPGGARRAVEETPGAGGRIGTAS
jgi:hypothetical protein